MQEKKIPQQVRDWMDEIEESIMGSAECMAELCDKLDHYANETDNTSLKGFSLFYRGFNKYANTQLEDGMEILSSSVNYLISAEMWRLAANAYNSMANIADFQGDVAMAVEYYLKGLAIASEQHIAKLEYTIYSGISNIYMGLGDYEKAVNMLLECERIRESGETVPANPLLVVTANLVSCYTYLGETEKAEKTLCELRKLYDEYPSGMNSMLLCILEAQLYHRIGNSEALDAAIAALNGMELNDIDVFGAFNELLLHAQLLLDLDRLEELNNLLSQLEALVDNPSIEQKILDLRMMYFYRLGDYEALAERALRSHEVSKLYEQERNKIANHNIVIRMRLDEEARRRQEVERSNLLLKQKSEHDALTGLNNRYKLNELAEFAFLNAQQNSTPLAIEILDIDCYKEFNDNYGHQAGDECLIRIAEAIRSMEEINGVHTARYGGDEFVIIYEGHAPEAVERMAQLLQKKIYDLNIRHEFSSVSDRVSISQGLFYSVPAGINKLWDFLYAADTILYGVKHRGKNNYHLEASFEGVGEYSSSAS